MARTLLKRKSTISNTPFFSIGDAFQLLVQSIESKIPNEFDCLVGIPRAGLLFANILASLYGRPLATPEGFVRGEVWYAGECIIPKYFKKVLVIEDSLFTGKQLKLAVEKLKDFKPEMEVKTASLFKKTGHDVAVDYVLVQHDCWTIGEWNLLTSLGFMGRLGVDLDGVLGEDCPTNVDDDGVQYCDWLSRAKPLFIPQFKVEAVITSRLEKYRPETEAWLRRHGVRYKVLIMLDLPSIKERTFNIVVRHKANAIRHADLEWYWESNWKEAEQIHRKTKCRNHHLSACIIDAARCLNSCLRLGFM
jgi:hypoxanthine phosphoribosyltransferase